MTRTYRLRVISTATGEPHPASGAFVQDADVDAQNGRGELLWTKDPADAMLFPSVDAAWTFWQRQSNVKAIRTDGKPNRPLTAFHMLIEPDE